MDAKIGARPRLAVARSFVLLGLRVTRCVRRCVPSTLLQNPPKASRTMGKAGAPHPALVHGALITTQVLFGAGSVVGALGLPSFNPLLFALIREGAAGPLLMAAAAVWAPTRVGDVLHEWRDFLWLGFFIFSNQLFFILGLKLSNPVAGSIWQPSQPIFTAAIAVWLGMEKPSRRRILGICVAFAGCAAMVALSSSGGSNNALVNELVGNCFFFLNCLATSLYVIRCKPLLRRFPALAVTAYSYMLASLMMGCTAVTLNSVRPALDFLCPDCGGHGWRVPAAALPALAYWILAQSCAAYGLMTWGNKYASASLVSAYTVLQPVTSSALTALILAANAYHNCAARDDDDHCLNYPGVGDLGAVGVFAGLYFVVTSEPALGAGGASDSDGEDAADAARGNPLLADVGRLNA